MSHSTGTASDSKPRRRRPRASTNELRERSEQRLEYPALLEIVAGYTLSAPGRAAVLESRPHYELDAAERAQRECDEVRLLRREGYGFRLRGLPDLGRFFDNPDAHATRVLTPRELADVAFVLERIHGIGTTLDRRTELVELHARAQRLIDHPELRAMLERSIDGVGEILSTASDLLAKLRQQAERIEVELRRYMEKKRESGELKKVLQDQIVTIRNGRFVFAVRLEHRHRVRGVVHGESASGSTLYIEPEAIVRRGDELDAARAAERREEQRILLELTRAIRAVREPIVGANGELIELDCTVARARFGDAFDARRPQLHDGRELTLNTARHPLLMWLERDVDGNLDDLGLARIHDVVEPLSLELSPNQYQAIITGPNTGGKTVVLKTVGLLTLMAMSGIPLPTDPGARIPCLRYVLADIGDEQSLEQSLSTFSSHMTITSEILEAANSRSLVLIDELGSGTDPLEGAALGEAILERLYERGVMALVTTHLGRLKEFAYVHRKCQNACMEFDPERLEPTYRLQVGLPGRSNALIIAERIGLPKDVIDSARRLQSDESRLDAEVLDGMQRTQRDLERKESEAARHEREAEQLKDDVEREREELVSRRKGIEYEAERAEQERVEQLILRLETRLRSLGTPNGEQRAAYDALRSELAEARKQTRLAERRHEFASKLKKGDQVFVPRLRQVCEIRKINRSKELITVSLNRVPTEIGYQDVSWILPPPGYDHDWYDPQRA